METLLDQSRKFAVLGPDENIWFFKWEQEQNLFGWHAYQRKPGQDVYLPVGPWAEDSVLRFLTKHSRKLTDSDRIDLFLYLHKGGIEVYLKKSRIKTKETE